MSIIAVVVNIAREQAQGKVGWAGGEEPRTEERPAPLGDWAEPTWLKESEGA